MRVVVRWWSAGKLVCDAVPGCFGCGWECGYGERVRERMGCGKGREGVRVGLDPVVHFARFPGLGVVEDLFCFGDENFFTG